MLSLPALLIITALIIEGFSYDGITFGKLTPEISEELEQIYKYPFPDLKPDCTELKEPQVYYFLYTRDNPNYPTILNPRYPTAVNRGKKTVLIIHGWLQKPTSSGISTLKNQYLERYESNVIVVDWSQMAFQPYTTSFCHVPRVAKNIADFLCTLKQIYVDLNSVHIIGHCLGGQIAGYAGKYVQKDCQRTIGRITGLNIAGPLFNDKTKSERLAPNDAEFVDVIHTDVFKYGYYNTCGSVDFYPNCGLEQPGCPFTYKINETSPFMYKIKETTLVSDLFCHHHRSLELMAESVTSGNLIAGSCDTCPSSCSSITTNEVYTVMGEDCRSTSNSTKFVISTNRSPPFGQGMDPYNMNLNLAVF